MSRNAAIGGTLWLGLLATTMFGRLGIGVIELLFLLGPLVVIPLGLELCSRCAHERELEIVIRVARRIQLPTAFCATASFWFLRGPASAALALVWFCFGTFVGICGLVSLIRGGLRSLKTTCMIVSFLYLPIGCAWLVASRLGLTPIGFQEPIVLLTAVHFHFAGFAAPLLVRAAEAGIRNGSIVARRCFKIVATGVVAGPGMLAAGFVIGPRLKLSGALLIACSEIGLALFFLAAIRALRPRIAQVLVAMSAASVLFAMPLAGIWAIGEFPLQPFVHLDEMARFHGTANALGFILCGLLGWTLSARDANTQKAGHNENCQSSEH
jgi:hypothetical protein